MLQTFITSSRSGMHCLQKRENPPLLSEIKGVMYKRKLNNKKTIED